MKTLNILDIDLDFFLTERTQSKNKSKKRQNSRVIFPWSHSAVKKFLEDACHLSTDCKIQGKTFVHHHELFTFLHELLNKNGGNLKFNIDHVDAHSDLGWGDNSFKYISSKILSLPVAERANKIKKSGANELTPANFLAFALACRWLVKLLYITNMSWTHDTPYFLLKNYDTEAETFQLQHFSADQFKDIFSYAPSKIQEVIRAAVPIVKYQEPEIPYKRIDYRQFNSTVKYDYIFLTHSPNYTPETADLLIPLIESYIAPLI